MREQADGAMVAALGIQLQLAGSLLCLGLGLFLRRGIGHRPWMTWWAWSFGAVAAAVTALLVRYNLIPLVPLASLQQNQTQFAGVLYAFYAGAKLLFLFCLVAGTWLFVTRQPVPRVGLGGAAALIAGVAMLFALKPTELNPLMAWQAGYAVPVFLACAWLLTRLPPERRTRGTRVLALVCLLHAGLWILYTPAFLGAQPDSSTAGRGFLGWLTGHNSYVDVLFGFLLVFGMILAVLDDVYQEAAAARLARLTELANSEARLDQIIRAASDGIVLLDAEHRIMHCNPASLEILGRGAEEILTQPFERFARGNTLEELWVRAAATGQRSLSTPPGGYEIRGLRGDGAEFPMEVSLRAIGKAEPEGYVLILRDQTHRVRLEEEQTRMQTQLAQAARLETIGRMVSGVAHELNNPLTAILAFAQDLQSQSRSLTDTEALTTIVQQSQRCRAIVQDLLTFARTKREDRHSLTPREIVDRVLPAFERQAAEQGVRIQVDVPPDLPPLHANPSAMEQVLTNLLSNAFHAVGSGGVVTLTCRVDDDRISLIVEDDGPGIPAEILPRLFEPFFTTKDPGQGTGLGLSVSHGIVEQHGGTLRAENRSGGEPGARFTVMLPFLDRRAVRRTAQLELPADDPLRAAPTGPGESAPRRVLVIDDEAPIRIAIRRFLERRGWLVEEAGNGREALEMLGLDGGDDSARIDRYDAIVTDLRMPGVSGIEIHDRLAAAGSSGLHKLVLISGDTASGEVVEFMSRIRQPIIQKPFDMRALADLLDQTAPPRSSAASTPPLPPPPPPRRVRGAVIALGYSLALVIGLSLGLLGGGGSILTVPVLHYVLGYDVKVAVPMSLVVVGLTSAAGSIAHWRAGTLHARTALAFGPPAVLGALLGAELGLKATPSLQLTVFALAMLAAAVAMYFGPALSSLSPLPPSDGGAPAGQEGSRRLPLVPLVGALVGLLTGFVGVGGGFLYVPALVILGGLPMKKAVGTSLVLILLSCIAGVVRYHGSLQLDWPAIARFTAIALVGVAIGSRLVGYVSQSALRRGFAVFLLVMGALVLFRGR